MVRRLVLSPPLRAESRLFRFVEINLQIGALVRGFSLAGTLRLFTTLRKPTWRRTVLYIVLVSFKPAVPPRILDCFPFLDLIHNSFQQFSVFTHVPPGLLLSLCTNLA